MKTCLKKTTVYDFLYKQTPTYSTWIIKDCGWRVGIVWIDDEDLWAGWYPNQHMDKYVKSYSYDENTKTGIIEVEE